MQTINLNEREKEILWRGEITSRQFSYGRFIDALRVEILVNDKNLWAYRIHTKVKTGYETSPSLIESKFKFSYDSQACNAAQQVIDLYWMACNKND